MSDFTRFTRTKSELTADAEKQVADFMKRCEQIKKLRVFGFASPDGEDGLNKDLAKKRAKAVMKEIGRKYPACSYPDCKINPIGEDHLINGIANSRSAVIAACFKEPGQAGTGGKTDTAAPACIGPS